MESANLRLPDSSVFEIDQITGRMFYYFTKPVESRVDGFYHIPGYFNYAITEDGQLYNLRTDNEIKWMPTRPVKKKNIRGGYRVCGVKNDAGHKTVLSRHRALMLTFKHPKVDPKRLIINHMDGIPGSDDLDNLEWCTYSENTKHAYATGLHSRKVLPIVAMNVNNGTIHVFKMLEQAAQFCMFKPEAIRARTRPPQNTKLYLDGWLFKVNDGSDWPEIEEGVYSHTGSYAILAKNIRTDVISVYDSAVNAGKDIGIDPNLIFDFIKDGRCTPFKDYVFRSASSDRALNTFPVFDRYDLMRVDMGMEYGLAFVEITEFDGMVTNRYLSIRHAAECMNVSQSTITRLIKGVKNPLDKTHSAIYYKVH